MSEQTSGTLTFLFTDVEGSTRLLRELGDDFPAVQARQQSVLRDAFADHGGRVVDSHGDSFFVAFTRPRDAVLAAVSAQQSLGAERWPPPVSSTSGSRCTAPRGFAPPVTVGRFCSHTRR